MDKKMKVWWVPRVPMTTAFEVEVSSVDEGAKLLNVLGLYDAFQYENRIKPDYCNAGGLEMLDDEGEWVEWYDDETGEDDPQAFVAIAKAEGK